MKEQSKKVLVSRAVEQYSRVLRQASAIARLDNITAVVWKRETGRFVDYIVLADGVECRHDGFVALVKVSPV